MRIERAIIKNYRRLKDANVTLNAGMNVLVGNNESGKSTFLEAMHLAMTGQLYGRNVSNELHPYLFNAEITADYIASLKAGSAMPPPEILIELYLAKEAQLAEWQGKNNSLRVDCPGIRLAIKFNEDYRAEYDAYIRDPSEMRAMPIEYYKVDWLSFAGATLSPRTKPLKTTIVDASVIRSHASAGRHILDIVQESLSAQDKVGLALSYRLLRDNFLEDARVKAINTALASRKGGISDKNISLSLDSTARAGWENSILPHLDEIPLTLVGKGEQNNIKVRLAIDKASPVNVVLVEEPENHLSHGNLGKLMEAISAAVSGRQVIVTTHSSFVINKLGVDATILAANNKFVRLTSLSPETTDYFMKLPGHDTLRMLLSDHAILVEGPSDELVIQKAFEKKHGKSPLHAGVDVISVRALAFKRFLELAQALDLKAVVVTDNDGDLAALTKKYAAFATSTKFKFCYSIDTALKTLEPQILSANGRANLNAIFDKSYATDAELLHWMENNKAEWALRFFSTDKPVQFPAYIDDAVT